MTQQRKFDELLVKRTLEKCWSKQSSTLWSKENPARGQCSVTSMVVQKLFGGEILKTLVNGQWHFYNVVNGIKYDLTMDQFDEPLSYTDLPSSREEAFADTNQEQYTYLLSKFKQTFSKT